MFVLSDYFTYSICTLVSFSDTRVRSCHVFLNEILDELTFFPRGEVEGMQHFTERDNLEIFLIQFFLPCL